MGRGDVCLGNRQHSPKLEQHEPECTMHMSPVVTSLPRKDNGLAFLSVHKGKRQWLYKRERERKGGGERRRDKHGG